MAFDFKKLIKDADENGNCIEIHEKITTATFMKMPMKQQLVVLFLGSKDRNQNGCLWARRQKRFFWYAIGFVSFIVLADIGPEKFVRLALQVSKLFPF